MNEFRALLQSRLRQRGDLAQLVKDSGIAGPVIIRWRDGENRPSPDSLKRLAAPLGVSYEELMAMCDYLPESDVEPTPEPDQKRSRIARLLEQVPESDLDRAEQVVRVFAVEPIRIGVKAARRKLIRNTARSGRFHAPVAA